MTKVAFYLEFTLKTMLNPAVVASTVQRRTLIRYTLVAGRQTILTNHY